LGNLRGRESREIIIRNVFAFVVFRDVTVNFLTMFSVILKCYRDILGPERRQCGKNTFGIAIFILV